MGLEQYHSKRDFSRTPEPEGGAGPQASGPPCFVVQKHAARQLHYDFRLELEGVLLSWAVPRGPSLDPSARRLAIRVEDHPLAYAGFEGVIPEGEYGGGTVLLWDRGRWFPEEDPALGLARGRLHFRLEGEKLQGEWVLLRMDTPSPQGREQWLLVKQADARARPDAEADITELRPESVLSGLDLDSIPQAGTGVPAPAAALPVRLAPQMAMLVEDSPREGLWLVEPRLDGYRLLARLDQGEVTLWSRHRQDWTRRFPRLAAELQRLPVRNAWLDGLVAMLDRQGRARLPPPGLPAPEDLRYFLFDLLFLDGQDLRPQPQLERKERLREMLAGTVQEALPATPARVLRYCGHSVGRLDEAFRHACLHGEDGVLLKRADAPYRAGRSPDWCKLKCGHRQSFVVGGFTAPDGRREGFGALLVGYVAADGGLVFAGRVGTGFDRAALLSLGERLQALRRPQCPFSSPPGPAERALVQWVAPELVVDVRFAGWTRAERLRQARFLGLREDKDPAEVIRERPLRDPDPSGAATRRPGEGPGGG